MRHCRPGIPQARTDWYDGVAGLPADWDDCLPAGHFLRASSLRVHEQSRAPHVAVRYALLRTAEGKAARAAFQVLSVRPEHVSSESLSKWQYAAWKIFTTTTHPRLLVGGQLFRHDVETVHFDERVTAYDAFVWYRSALRAATRQCGVQAVLVKDPPEQLVPLFMHNAPDYLLLRNDSSMQLALPPEWQSMHDYEKSLKHKYAQRLRKVRQPWGALDIRELDGAEVQAASSDIYALYLQVTDHQCVRMGLLSEAFIPMLKSYYGDQLKVWGVYEGGRMVAFASAWVESGRFDMFYIGFDYARNSELQLYFNILFFAIEQAIVLRKPLLVLGRTALEAKARVGCRPVYLNSFLHIRNPLLRGIVSALQNKLGESGSEWEQRHPFRHGPGFA
jgi:hypothetical protein